MGGIEQCDDPDCQRNRVLAKGSSGDCALTSEVQQGGDADSHEKLVSGKSKSMS
jgi:hypothetical protein